MYCKNCGSAVDDNSSYCYNCGAWLGNDPATNVPKDNSTFWFSVLGFFIPIVGLILFLVYEYKNPKRSRAAGKGALIGFITRIALSIVLVIISVIFYFVFAASIFSNLSMWS